MITLDKLTLQVGAKLFTERTQKLIRIQAQNSIIKTKSPAKLTSQTHLQWDETIELPLVYNQSMPFEIYDKHEFGYNPEEIKSVIHGTIVFMQGNDKFNNFEIFDINDKKIGYFSVNIKNKPAKAVSLEKSQLNPGVSSSPGKKKIVDQTQLLIISSIVVNLPLIKAKRGYALISVGENEAKTSPVKSKAGELVFIEKYQLDKNPSTIEGVIQIYSCGTDEPDQKIAAGSFKIENKIDRKIKFFDGQNHEIGEGFIDGMVELRSDAVANKMFASIIREGINKQFSLPQSRGNTMKEMSRSLVSNSSFMRGNDASLSRGKKMSVVSYNNNIRFGQQRRFFSSGDPANNKCSYLKEGERSFEFKERQVEKYYRGASIGYGGKADFTQGKKDLPSVGKYHLPSIWDRY